MFKPIFSSLGGNLICTQLTEANTLVATNDQGDYHFTFRELTDAGYTVRIYDLRSVSRETYSITSEATTCLRMGRSGSVTFHLPQMGNLVFHQRDYNLLQFPQGATAFTLEPGAQVSFMDIVLNDAQLDLMSSLHPALYRFLNRPGNGLPGRLNDRNGVAETGLLRWQDELVHTAAQAVTDEPIITGHLTHQLVKTAIAGLVNGRGYRSLKLNMADVYLLYQVAAFLETTQHTVTVKYLSTQFNISSYKLEKGFKELFGYAVLRHRYEERMRKALRLVNDSRYNSKQVAALLGYSEPQSFSRAFRKRFGYAPYRPTPALAVR